jgi:type IV secretion system protein VirB6
MACAPFPSSGGFLAGLVEFIDCQTLAIGAQGYLGLTAPGSSFSILLTTLLTLFVALFGYRLLFGEAPGVRDGVLAVIKVGIVLVLATNWGAYRTLFYDVALRGPAEVAAEIGGPAGLPGAGGGLVSRLDYLDRSMIALVSQGVSGGVRTGTVQAPGGAATTPPEGVDSSFDWIALGAARLAYLTATIGSLGSVRLMAGLLLAVGPIFIAMLLFRGTIGLFEGWLRVLLGTALAAVGTTIILGVELALLEPRLAYLLSLRSVGQPITGAPTELLATTLIFALILIATLYGSARVALGLRLPAAGPWREAGAENRRTIEIEQRTDRTRAGSEMPVHSRAAAVADAIATSQRRESQAGGMIMAEAPRRAEPHRRSDAAGPATPAVIPLGQSFRRRTQGRVSASAIRRDRAS